MTPDEKQRLKEAFNTWAQNVPDPDAPAMGFIGQKLLSAREAAAAVQAETPTGRDILSILEHGVKVEGIDKVVARLTRDVPKS